MVVQNGGAAPSLATGDTVIKGPSPLNVLKDAYNHSCCRARSYEYNHLMTDSPGATPRPGAAAVLAEAAARVRPSYMIQPLV